MHTDINMITLINYGLGNIKAFYNIYTHLNIPVKIASSPGDLFSAKKLILPGVGSFDWAMDSLNRSGMREALDELVLNKCVPILGICVGMQMMANSSEEGTQQGLSWLDTNVLKLENLPNVPLDSDAGFESNSEKKNSHFLPLPHMGWNDVKILNNHPLFNEIVDPRYYFLHSYYCYTSNLSTILATSSYSHDFTVAIGSDNILGVQFHPEKSHSFGIQLLKNFASL